MQLPHSISWEAHEYEHKEKSVDWFWALGIIALSVVVASVIKGNYVFALFIIVAASCLGYFSARKPEIIDIELSEKGFRIHRYLYEYKDLKAFFVEHTQTGPKLHIMTSRVFFPIITLPLEDIDPDLVTAYLAQFLKEEEMHESRAHKFMETLGF